IARRGTPIVSALDALCDRCRYLWWERGGVIYCRSRGWFSDEDYEVPDSFIELWTRAVSAGRPLGIGDVSALAALTPHQRNGLGRLGDPLSTGLGADADVFQSFLSCYESWGPFAQRDVLGPGFVAPPD